FVSIIFVFFIIRRLGGSIFFPYTALFRSLIGQGANCRVNGVIGIVAWFITPDGQIEHLHAETLVMFDQPAQTAQNVTLFDLIARSEEHTSELQSRENLVCRLLLEKKKK